MKVELQTTFPDCLSARPVVSVVCVFETDIRELFLSFKDEFFVNNFVGKYIFFSF